MKSTSHDFELLHVPSSAERQAPNSTEPIDADFDHFCGCTHFRHTHIIIHACYVFFLLSSWEMFMCWPGTYAGIFSRQALYYCIDSRGWTTGMYYHGAWFGDTCGAKNPHWKKSRLSHVCKNIKWGSCSIDRLRRMFHGACEKHNAKVTAILWR